jgi:hypothetical protein
VKMKDILKGKLNEQRQETEKVPSKGPSYWSTVRHCQNFRPWIL